MNVPSAQHFRGRVVPKARHRCAKALDDINDDNKHLILVGSKVIEKFCCLTARVPSFLVPILGRLLGSRWLQSLPAGINITFELQEIIGLRHHGKLTEGAPESAEGRAFAVLIGHNTDAFEELYVCTFELLDRQWVDCGATYFEFQHVIRKTLNAVKSTLSTRPKTMLEVRQMLLL